MPNGERKATNKALITAEFENTLEALENMGVKTIVFSPPPANGINLGRCLTRADWKGKTLDACNFNKDKMLDIRQTVYEFLDRIEDKYEVVRLDDYMCEDAINDQTDNDQKGQCNTHIDSTYLFRDEGHLSHEGTALLEKKYQFYDTIIQPRVAEHRRIEKIVTEQKTGNGDLVSNQIISETQNQTKRKGVVILDSLRIEKTETESEVISVKKK